MGSYARGDVDETAAAPGTRAERRGARDRGHAERDPRGGPVGDPGRRLRALSTRRVADLAGVPLSQIHYHFGSKRQLVLAVLAAENERLLERQAEMYDAPDPLWVRWDRACDFLDADLRSGYVRILHEMIAAGWSDAEVASSVREMISGWFMLLADVARREQERGTRSRPVHARGGRSADGPPVHRRRVDAAARRERGRRCRPAPPSARWGPSCDG